MQQIPNYRGYVLPAIEHSPFICVNFAPDRVGSLINSSPFCAGSLAEALEGAKVLIDEHLDSIGKAYPSGFRV